jgi:hypothetical protein
MTRFGFISVFNKAIRNAIITFIYYFPLLILFENCYMNHLRTPDYIVFLIYFIVVATYGYWIYHRKKAAQMDSKDFFLAEGSLTWWAIGASLIASNISAEHFIGMSGPALRWALRSPRMNGWRQQH